jgi:hypothetical protein
MLPNQRGTLETALAREHPLEGSSWLVLSRRRRLTIGDLMVAVALAAFALAAVALADLTTSKRAGFGVVTLIFLGLQAAQWRIASIPAGQFRPRMGTVVGTLSFLVALSMLVCLIILGFIFPGEVPLVIGIMLVLAVYLTTWD